MGRRAVVLFSGGQDSTTCLYWAKKAYTSVHALTIFYGQRHRCEIDSAVAIADDANVPHEVVHLSDGVLAGTSPLVSDVELETYADAASLPGGIEKTFVPMRNALFLTIAANRAAVLGADAIVTGVSEEDYGGYPDCRQEFLRATDTMVCRALQESVEVRPVIEAPLIVMNKRQTVLLAKDLGEDCWRALGKSHTCYAGDHPGCGSCHACLLRAKGFEEAGYADPLFEEKA
jgi:7-cyano-7-deazaguanine synthase